MGIGAAVGGLASLGGSLFSSGAATSAASQSSQAQMMSAMMQMQMFQAQQANQQPFIQAGQGAMGQIQQLTGTGAGGNPLTAPLTSQFQPTMAQLAATPGYQFTLQQGLNATQNGYAARGLGTSGPALRGAADYAAGLASQTYQQQFQNYWTGNQNTYNMLAGQGQLGANVAVNQGTQSTQVGNNVGNAIAGAGQAQALGTIGSANALTGGLNNAIYGNIPTNANNLGNTLGNALTNAWSNYGPNSDSLQAGAAFGLANGLSPSESTYLG